MAVDIASQAGSTAIKEKGWLRANQWLLLRRFSQLSILSLFLSGPWFGYWIAKGNLTSSLTFDVLPLTDPYIFLQSVVAGHSMISTAVYGAIIVTVFYLLVGGRVFCSWVCPVNMVTDSADWLRRKLHIKGGAHFSRSTRYWILLMTLMVAGITSSIAWELVNPVSISHRAIIFGGASAWLVMVMIFLLDMFVSRHGWCGHLCPVGAFYSLLGKWSLVRMSAIKRQQCDDCMDCFMVCPEEQVIKPALKGEARGIGPVIMDMNCTNCGRCIDVCTKSVFTFSHRFKNYSPTDLANKKEVAP